MTRLRTAAKKLLTLASASAIWSLTGWSLVPSATENAVANGDTRTIHFYHTHTGESIDATFRVDGHYDQAVLDKLNYFLRDWRNNDQTTMDPRLFDTIWEVYRTAGADQPIQIYSAYRSPETNAMLRRRSRAVAEHSQHMLGKAMDTTMPGMSMEKIREIGMRLQHGGVGYYQAANFVHLDVGGVRSWPRMSYDQLARLFPDGKTVHIPSNGQPMARYEEARAEIAARGGTEIPPAQESQGFFAWLFGGSGGGASHEDEEDRTAVAARNQAHGQAIAVAYNNPEGDEGAAVRDVRTRQAAITPPAAPAPDQVQPPASASQPPRESAAVQPNAETAEPAPAEFGGVIPLPPRRPAELVDTAEAIPLPPIRPDGASKVQVASADDSVVPLPVVRPAAVPDAIGGLITSSPSGVPMLSRSALPAIITQGSENDANRLPNPALAFAAAETTSSLRPSVRESLVHASSPIRGLALRAVTALRIARRAPKTTTVASVDAVSVQGPAALAGPSIVGLRKAAKGVASKAAL